MAWARVQSKSGSVNGTTPLTITLTSTPTPGNKIIVAFSGGAVTSVKDGNNNSLTLLGTANNASGDITVLYGYDVPATPSAVFNVALSTTFGSGVAQEISGLATGNTTAMLDGTPGTLTGSSSTNFSTGSPTYSSTAANEYHSSVYGDWGNSATATTPAGYTLDANSVNGSAISDCCVAFKNSTGGAETGSWSVTNSGSDVWAMLTVSFKLAVPVDNTTKPVMAGVFDPTLNPTAWF